MKDSMHYFPEFIPFMSPLLYTRIANDCLQQFLCKKHSVNKKNIYRYKCNTAPLTVQKLSITQYS